jgi:hypothetical protein
LGIGGLEVGKDDLRWSQGVVASDRAGLIQRHQHPALADAFAHVLVRMFLQKGIQRRLTAAKDRAIVPLRIKQLLFKHA